MRPIDEIKADIAYEAGRNDDSTAVKQFKVDMLDIELHAQQERENGCEWCNPDNLAMYYAGKIPKYCKYCGRKLVEG